MHCEAIRLRSLSDEQFCRATTRSAMAVPGAPASRYGSISKFTSSSMASAIGRYESTLCVLSEGLGTHGLQQTIAAYIDAAGLRNAAKDAPLFRAAVGRSPRLAERPSM
jgi:hypothetical protein